MAIFLFSTNFNYCFSTTNIHQFFFFLIKQLKFHEKFNIFEYDTIKKDTSGLLKALALFTNKANYRSFNNIQFEKIKCRYFTQHLLF